MKTLTRFYSQLSLRVRLLGAFTFIALVLLVTGAVAFSSSRQVVAQFDLILRVNAVQERAVAQMRDAAKDEIRYISKLGLGNLKGSDHQRIFEKIHDLREQYSSQEERLKPLLESDDQKKAFASLTEAWKNLNDNIDEIITLFKTNADNPNRTKLVQLYYAELEQQVDNLFENVAKMEQSVRASSDARQSAALHAADKGNESIIAAVISGFVFSLLAGYTLSGRLARQLNRISKNLTDQSRALIAIAGEIVEGGAHFLERAQQQHEAIEKTSKSTHQINALIQQNNENARATAESSKLSQNAVENGRSSIHHMTNVIVDINSSTQKIAEQVRETHKRMNDFVKMIEEISHKTQVINDIVFQTRLLSFNASVEAARAGAAGKGFAVVAEEIGILAVSSGNAASEIARLLNNSVEAVERMVDETNAMVESSLADSERKAEIGSAASRGCVDVFETVVQNMKEILEHIGHISEASLSEVHGLNSVRETIGELENLANENREAVHSFEGSAENLQNQADAVLVAVQQLQDILNGRKSRDSARIAAVGARRQDQSRTRLAS